MEAYVAAKARLLLQQEAEDTAGSIGMSLFAGDCPTDARKNPADLLAGTGRRLL